MVKQPSPDQTQERSARLLPHESQRSLTSKGGWAKRQRVLYVQRPRTQSLQGAVGSGGSGEEQMASDACGRRVPH